MYFSTTPPDCNKYNKKSECKHSWGQRIVSTLNVTLCFFYDFKCTFSTKQNIFQKTGYITFAQSVLSFLLLKSYKWQRMTDMLIFINCITLKEQRIICCKWIILFKCIFAWFVTVLPVIQTTEITWHGWIMC